MFQLSENNQNDFFKWLSSFVSANQLSEMFFIYNEIDNFCHKKGIIEKSIFSINDLDILKIVVRTVENNDSFRYVHGKYIKNYILAVRYYYQYVKMGSVHDKKDENNSEKTIVKNDGFSNESTNPTMHNNDKALFDKYPIAYKRIYNFLKESTFDSDIGVSANRVFESINHIVRIEAVYDILNNASWSIKTGQRYLYSDNDKYSESNKRQGNIDKYLDNSIYEKQPCLTVDFNDRTLDYAFTVPISLSYFDVTKSGFRSWTGLYVFFINLIYEDYPEKLPIGELFHGAKRIDFGDLEMSKNMISPKKIGDNLFVETNLSAKNIIGKIKALLNICLVDFENVVICYENKSNVEIKEKSGFENKESTKASKSDVYYESLNDYSKWLVEVRGMDQNTANGYTSALKIISKRFKEWNLTNKLIFEIEDIDELNSIIERIFKNQEFIAFNIKHHNRFSAAIKKFINYKNDSKNNQNVIKDNKNIIDLTPYELILQEVFSKGFRLGSTIEMKKFKRQWTMLCDEDIQLETAEIEQNIKQCGITFDNRVYIPSIMLSDELKEKVFTFIQKSFDLNGNSIHISVIFNEFSDEFLEYCMYNSDMLKAYLMYVNEGQYSFSGNYILKDKNIVMSTEEEVRNCLINSGIPMTYEMIYDKLPHLSTQRIKQTLNLGSEYISNGRNEYFHIDITVLSDDYLDVISNIISNTINEKRFLSGNELIKDISARYPEIIENNSELSETGLRNAIGYRLRDRYSFDGNIISAMDDKLSMMDVFSQFCKTRDYFTLDELKVLKQELNTVIYFDAVYSNSLRISKTEFVSKKQAAFDVEATDLVIGRFCAENDYIPIRAVKNFGSFPNSGFQWNSFLLEHYVADYSNDFKLLHTTYNENSCVGAIVKRHSSINTFDELVIDALAKSYVLLDKENALDFLYDNGYLARRHFSNIETVLIKAKERRNQRRI